jgi:hypothetical protein
VALNASDEIRVRHATAAKKHFVRRRAKPAHGRAHGYCTELRERCLNVLGTMFRADVSLHPFEREEVTPGALRGRPFEVGIRRERLQQIR